MFHVKHHELLCGSEAWEAFLRGDYLPGGYLRGGYLGGRPSDKAKAEYKSGDVSRETSPPCSYCAVFMV